MRAQEFSAQDRRGIRFAVPQSAQQSRQGSSTPAAMLYLSTTEYVLYTEYLVRLIADGFKCGMIVETIF